MGKGTTKRTLRLHRSRHRLRRTYGSIHKDYADFAKFYHTFRRDWGKYLKDFKVFLVSLSGSVILKHFTFNHLIETYKKEA